MSTKLRNFVKSAKKLTNSSCIRNFHQTNKRALSNATDMNHEENEEYNHDEEDLHKQYQTHIPTTAFQKTLLSLGSSLVAISAPWRSDSISTLGETTGQFALQRMKQKMLADAVGREILEDQPRINTCTVDLEYLRGLPEETFGKTYATWLDVNKCNPDERDPVHFVDDPSLAYVMTRYRECHDLYHCILGMPTHMLGEVVVKWVEALQTGLPMCVAGGIMGPIRLGPKHIQIYRDSHIGWALRNGYQSKFYLNVYFEKHWEMPMAELRNLMNIEPPPPTPEKLKS